MRTLMMISFVVASAACAGPPQGPDQLEDLDLVEDVSAEEQELKQSFCDWEYQYCMRICQRYGCEDDSACLNQWYGCMICPSWPCQY